MQKWIALQSLTGMVSSAIPFLRTRFSLHLPIYGLSYNLDLRSLINCLLTFTKTLARHAVAHHHFFNQANSRCKHNRNELLQTLTYMWWNRKSQNGEGRGADRLGATAWLASLMDLADSCMQIPHLEKTLCASKTFQLLT